MEKAKTILEDQYEKANQVKTETNILTQKTPPENHKQLPDCSYANFYIFLYVAPIKLLQIALPYSL